MIARLAGIALIGGLMLQGCSTAERPPTTIQVSSRQLANDTELVINGHGYTADEKANIQIKNFPGSEADLQRSVDVDDSGSFVYSERFKLVRWTRFDPPPDFVVTVTDPETAQLDAASVGAAPFVSH